MNQVDTPTAHGLSDLHIAVISGQASRVLKSFIGHKKELLNVGDVDGTTPLMAAVLTGRQTIARLLLRNGASVHLQDRRGYQAVEYSRFSLFKAKLDTYKRLGFPEVGPGQQ
jgi:ankyrin repeat protein